MYFTFSMVAMNSMARVMRWSRVTNITRYAIFSVLEQNKKKNTDSFTVAPFIYVYRLRICAGFSCSCLDVNRAKAEHSAPCVLQYEFMLQKGSVGSCFRILLDWPQCYTWYSQSLQSMGRSMESKWCQNIHAIKAYATF